MQVRVIIRKDGFVASRPWRADVELDGTLFRNWMTGFKTRKALMREVQAVAPKAEVVG